MANIDNPSREPDFTLVVGANVELSYKRMQKDISDIVKLLNDNPQKVQIGLEIDHDAIEKFRAEVASIHNAMGGFGRVTINPVDASGIDSAINGINNLTQNTKGAISVVQTMSAELNSVNVERIRAAIASIDGVTPQGAVALAQSLGEANVRATEVKARLIDAADAEQQLVSLQIKGTNEAGQMVKYLLTYNTETGEISQKMLDITARLKETDNVESRRAITIREIINLYREMYVLMRDNPETSDITSYESLTASAEMLKNVLSLVEAESLSVEEAFSRMGLNGVSTIDMAKNAISSFKLELEQATAPKLTEESSQYASALSKVNVLLRQVINNTEKWTKAKTGKSSEKYDIYAEQADELEKLKQELKDCKLSAEEFDKKFAKIKNTVDNAATAIKDADEDTRSLTDRIGGLASKFSTWFSISNVIMSIYRAARKMFDVIVDIDKAMTELRKVTNETDTTYTEFLNNAAARATKLGAKVSDVVNASADFARLGYSIQDASELADVAIVYKNVGDGIEDINTASESIIATMQAFGISTGDAIQIVDKFNAVGNNYAISSKGVGDALLRSAAAMKAANNTLDETIALAAAANTIIQDPEKVGTTLKTVSMYLRAAKTEAEDAGESVEGMASSVSELRKDILQLTGNKVDIQLDDNTYKSTYRILQELSAVWNDLSDISQANILEMIGGKRNSNVVAAILENFTVASEAVETSADAAGSALKENEEHLNSISGKMQKFSAAFETLSQTAVDSDLVKWAIDTGTLLLEISAGLFKIINLIGGLKTVLMSVVAIIAVLKADTIAKTISVIAKKLVDLESNISNLNFSLKTARNAWANFTAGTGSGSAAISASLPIIGMAIAAITLLTSAVSAYNQKQKEMREKQIDAANNAYNIGAETRDLAEKLTKLEESVRNGTSSYDELIKTENEFLNQLDIEKEYLDSLIEKYGSYRQALRAAKNEKAKEDVRTYADALGAAAKNLKSPVLTIDLTYEKDRQGLVKILNSLSEDNLPLRYRKDGSTSGDLDLMTGDVFELGYNDWSNAGDSPAQIVKQYKLIDETLDYIYDKFGNDNTIYSHLNRIYNEGISAVEAYNELVQKSNENIAEANINDYMLRNPFEGETQTDFQIYLKDLTGFVSASGQVVGTSEDVANAVESVIALYPEFAEFIYKTNDGSDSLAEPFVSNSEALLQGLNKLKSGISSLNGVYQNVLKGGVFDLSFIEDDNFKNAFSGLGSAYTNFIDTISKSPTDINKCQAAFDTLIQSYISSTGVLSEVTTETRDLAIAQLEALGVANAAEVVDAATARNKADLTYITEEYKNKTLDGVLALYEECSAGDNARASLARLAVEKMLFNNNKINTVSDCQQLLNLAKAAGVTAASLANIEQIQVWTKELRYVQGVIQGIEHSGSITDPAQRQWWYNEEKRLQNLIANGWKNPISYDDIKFEGFTTSSSSSSSDKTETWFDKQLREHKHYLAMNQETEAEYLAWLSSAYQKAYKEKIIGIDDYYQYQEEVYELGKKLTDDIKASIDELVDYRINMLKRDIENEKDALNEKLDNLRDFYDKQKDMLQAQYDEEKYLKDQSEKRKVVSDIESELEQIKYDDSAWAEKRRLELNEELIIAKEELDEFEEEHLLDTMIEFLDKEYEEQESVITAQIDALEDKLNDPHALYNQALKDIETNTGGLYQAMIDYNRKYGTGNDEDIKNKWDNAYSNSSNYKDAFGSPYLGIDIPSSSNAIATTQPKTPPVGSRVLLKATATNLGALSGNIPLTETSIWKRGGDALTKSTYGTVAEVKNGQARLTYGLENLGWVNISDIVGYATGTKNATKGLHRIDELGAEYLFTSKDGNRYRILDSGDKVLNAGATNFLYDFANSRGNILAGIVNGVLQNLPQLGNKVNHNEIHTGDIHIHGNADERTVSEIRREQRAGVEYILKEISRLSK